MLKDAAKCHVCTHAPCCSYPAEHECISFPDKSYQRRVRLKTLNLKLSNLTVNSFATQYFSSNAQALQQHKRNLASYLALHKTQPCSSELIGYSTWSEQHWFELLFQLLKNLKMAFHYFRRLAARQSNISTYTTTVETQCYLRRCRRWHASHIVVRHAAGCQCDQSSCWNCSIGDSNRNTTRWVTFLSILFGGNWNTYSAHSWLPVSFSFQTFKDELLSERRAPTFLFQRISVAIQRFNHRYRKFIIIFIYSIKVTQGR